LKNVHCIGDKANHIVLNAMEKALLKLPEHERAARRLRLEHAQIMKLDDLDRAAKLGSKCPAGIPQAMLMLLCFSSHRKLSTDSCDIGRKSEDPGSGGVGAS
jgi:hypothetical protein